MPATNSPKNLQRAIAILAVTAVVVALAIVFLSRETLPDFTAYEAGPERKTAFFDYLRPLVAEANAALAADRELLLTIAERETLGRADRRWLERAASRFELEYDPERPRAVVDALRRRLDVIPPSLVLAQAAKESGWGTSRFAREGNNLFGEWCFSEGCGIVPGRRAPGRTHEVRSFDSPREAIDSYLMTLNTHPAYRELRAIRAQSRAQQRALSGRRLAAGLSRYSERGQAYVDEIRSLIRFNGLE